MKKKNYVAPSMKIIMLEQGNQMLMASGPGTGGTATPGHGASHRFLDDSED